MPNQYSTRVADNPLCAIDGCEKLRYQRRLLCGTHYNRKYRRGDPHSIKPVWPPAEERFWAHVEVRGDDECWPWTGERMKAGYGRFCPVGRRPVSTHRYSWRLANPDAPEPVMVRHSCDNPPCANPRHLRAGTALDNMRDKMKRGRWSNGRKKVDVGART